MKRIRVEIGGKLVRVPKRIAKRAGRMRVWLKKKQQKARTPKPTWNQAMRKKRLQEMPESAYLPERKKR